MSNYSAMQVTIQNELKRDDLSTEIALAIRTAVNVYQHEHFFFNETVELTATVSSGSEYYDLPDDFQEFISITLNTNNYTYALQQRPWKYIDDKATNDNWKGRPEDFAILGEQYRLYPIPNETYTLNLSYTSTLDNIWNSNTSPWFNVAEDMIRYEAKSDVLLNVIRGPEAVQEGQIQQMLAKRAYDRLKRQSNKRRSASQMLPFY